MNQIAVIINTIVTIIIIIITGLYDSISDGKEQLSYSIIPCLMEMQRGGGGHLSGLRKRFSLKSGDQIKFN